MEYVRSSIRFLSTVRRRMKNQTEKRTSVLQIMAERGGDLSDVVYITTTSNPSVSRNYGKFGKSIQMKFSTDEKTKYSM